MTTAKKRTAVPAAKTSAPKTPSPKTASPRTSRKSASTPDQYTNPELREHIKQQVLAGDKGGKSGQWSARKAQLVAAEYEREGGGYKHPRTEAQEHLHEWTEEHWQTSDSQPARRGLVTTRYLPAKAWEQLSPERKKATNQKKIEGSRKGKQFVANTPDAAAARRVATRGSEASSHTVKSRSDTASGTQSKTAMKGGGSAKRPVSR